MSFTNKTSRTTPASNVPALVPEFPRASPTLLTVPGFQEQDVKYANWWDAVKAALFKSDQKFGLQLRSQNASIIEEANIRSAADGFLEGKYTLTVTAGSVVTGMEITSSTSDNAGTVSEVAFQADKFQIYTGSLKKVMFVADGTQNKVRLGGCFTVDSTANAIYIKTTAGAGAWNDVNTPFYVNSSGNFSLKNKLVWDDSLNLLVVNGSIYSQDGQIGGFTIGATKFTAGTSGTYIELCNDTSLTFPYLQFGQLSGPCGFYSRDGASWIDGTGKRSGIGWNSTDHGYVRVYNSASTTPYIELVASNGYITFFGDTNIYRSTSNTLKTDDSFIVGTNLSVSGNVSTVMKGPDGSTSAPTWSFSSDTDTGWRWNSSGDMRAVTNGSDRFVVRDAAIVCLQPLKLDNAYVAGAPSATGYITVQDNSGTTYKVLVGT